MSIPHDFTFARRLDAVHRYGCAEYRRGVRDTLKVIAGCILVVLFFAFYFSVGAQ